MGEVQHGKTTKWKPNGKRTTQQQNKIFLKTKKQQPHTQKSNEIKGFKGLHTAENKTKQQTNTTTRIEENVEEKMGGDLLGLKSTRQEERKDNFCNSKQLLGKRKRHAD